MSVAENDVSRQRDESFLTSWIVTGVANGSRSSGNPVPRPLALAFAFEDSPALSFKYVRPLGLVPLKA